MYSGGFLPPSGPFTGFPPGSDYFPDINSCGRNPQAYTNAIINRGGPLGPMLPNQGMIPYPPTTPPYTPGMAAPVAPQQPMMIPADRFHQSEGSEEGGVPSWLSNPVFRWSLYALAAVAVWKLGMNLIVKDLFRSR
jgi:hypothetical protein